MEDNSQLIDDIKNLSDEEMDAMSPEELQEMDNVLASAEQPPEMNKLSQGTAAAAQVEEEKSITDHIADAGSYVAETVADTALAIGDNIPGTESLSALVGTGIDYATDREGSSFSDTFANNRQNVQQSEQQAAERSPIATTGGHFVSDAAQFTMGGAALGGFKAVKAAAKIAPKATALISAISADAGVGFVQKYSEAETAGLETVLASGQEALGQALLGAGLGSIAGKGLKILGGVAGDGLISPLRRRVTALQTHNNVKGALHKMNKFTDKAGITTKDFMNRLSKLGLGDKNSLATAGRASNMIDDHIPAKLGEELDQLYTIAAEKGLKIDTRSLYGRVESSLMEIYKAGDADIPKNVKNRIGQILQGLKGTVQEEGKNGIVSNDLYPDLDVKQAWKLLQNMEDLIPKGRLSKLKDKALGEFRSEIKSVINAAGDEGDEVLKALKTKLNSKNLDYSIVKTAQDMTRGLNLAQDQGKLLGNTARDMFNGGMLYGAGGIAGYAATGTTEGALAGAGIMAGARALSRSPGALLRMDSMITNAADGSLRQGLTKYGQMGDWIQNNYKSIPAAAAIGSRLNSILANQDVDAGEIDKLVHLTGSIKNLTEAPLGRTEESFNERSEDVLRIVNDVNPDMGAQLLDMIKNGEDVGSVMSMIAKMPEAKGLIEPGMGWNGRVYSEEEKAGLIEEVKGTANINGSRKAQLIRSISETGQIPDLAAEPKRQPMKYNPRDKSKERY